MTHCQLYLISPPAIDTDSFTVQLQQAFEGGDIAAFQLRLKDVSDDVLIDVASKCKEICHQHGTQFIINDRPDIAKKVDADGVHIGEDDGAYEQARTLLGNDKVIGVSCYDSTDRALDLAQKGADYVSFGAFFPTTTKKPKANPSPDIISWWSINSNVPCVAIGGITAQNCQPLIENGADFIAVVSAIWSHPDGVASAITQLHNALKQS